MDMINNMRHFLAIFWTLVLDCQTFINWSTY